MEVGLVADGGGIEQHEVREGAFADDAAVLQAEHLGGAAGHLVDRLLHAEEAEVARIVAEHAREGAPEARVGIGVVRQSVAADHREVVLHDPLHVLFVHLEEDGAGGEEFLGGFFRGGVPLLGDVVEHAAGEFGMRDRTR